MKNAMARGGKSRSKIYRRLSCIRVSAHTWAAGMAISAVKNAMVLAAYPVTIGAYLARL
jgi:hypothetical protein